MERDEKQAMSRQEQINAFARDVNALIDRYAAEFNLTVADAVGVLELCKLDLWHRESNKEKDVE